MPACQGSTVQALSSISPILYLKLLLTFSSKVHFIHDTTLSMLVLPHIVRRQIMVIFSRTYIYFKMIMNAYTKYIQSFCFPQKSSLKMVSNVINHIYKEDIVLFGCFILLLLFSFWFCSCFCEKVRLTP